MLGDGGKAVNEPAAVQTSSPESSAAQGSAAPTTDQAGHSGISPATDKTPSKEIDFKPWVGDGTGPLASWLTKVTRGAVWRISFYFLHACTAPFMLLGYRFRAWGQHHVPRGRPVLFVGNHQSFLDPVAFGFGMHFRGFSALARASLWKNGIVGLLLNMLRTIPVRLGEADRRAIQRCIRTLEEGRTVLLYPEGTRSPTEQTETFKPGILLMAKKVKPDIVPVAVHGTFRAWSRWRKLPRLTGRIGVIYGKPIPAEQLLAMRGAGASQWLRDEVERLRLELVDKLDGRPSDGKEEV